MVVSRLRELVHPSCWSRRKCRHLREHRRSRCRRHTTELSHPSRPGTRSSASYSLWSCLYSRTTGNAMRPQGRKPISAFSAFHQELEVVDPMESRRRFAVSMEENLGREASPISRACMRGTWYLPNFGPVHQKAGKPKRDPAVRDLIPKSHPEVSYETQL